MNKPASAFHAYYLGLPEAGGFSFEQDLASVMPPSVRFETLNGAQSGWLYLDVFQPGGLADSIKGQRRTFFIVACYFTVLIDQVFHRHMRRLHPEYERLKSPPKLSTTIPNIHPNCLLDRKFLQGAPDFLSVALEAWPVVEEAFLMFFWFNFFEEHAFDALAHVRREYHEDLLGLENRGRFHPNT